MTTNKLERLFASLEKSEAKVEKIKTTIERHFKQLDKKVATLAKAGMDIDVSGIEYQVKNRVEFGKQIAHIEAQKWGEDGKGVPQYWELCELVYKMDDIYSSYKKLADAEQVVSNWKVKVVAEQTRVDFASSAPQVIVDFVNKWGELAFEWLMVNSKFPNEESIRKTIENEKQIKIIQLTMRVTDAVGTITNAKGLEISEKGDLVGIIVGEKGKAKVETISAGGWNIQCFHYRTLVHTI
jgi:hypothetical protein